MTTNLVRLDKGTRKRCRICLRGAAYAATEIGRRGAKKQSSYCVRHAAGHCDLSLGELRALGWDDLAVAVEELWGP